MGRRKRTEEPLTTALAAALAREALPIEKKKNPVSFSVVLKYRNYDNFVELQIGAVEKWAPKSS